MEQSVSPQAWLAADLAASTEWIHRLDAAAVEGIEHALAHAKACGKPWLAMQAEDFPLNEAAAAALHRAFDATQGRWGLCLVKGFPVERWTEADAKLVFWGVGLHVGLARTQNKASDIMTDVRDVGGSYKTKDGRGYNTNAKLDFHIDSGDVVALLTLQTAKSGGESKITSSIALRDESTVDRSISVALWSGAASFGTGRSGGVPMTTARTGRRTERARPAGRPAAWRASGPAARS